MPLRVSPVSRRAFIVMRFEGSYPLPNCSHWSSEVLGWPHKTAHTFRHGEFPTKYPHHIVNLQKHYPCEVHEMSGMPRVFTNKVQRSFLKTFFSWICVSRTKAILVATTMICSNAPSDLSAVSNASGIFIQNIYMWEYSWWSAKSFLWWINDHNVIRLRWSFRSSIQVLFFSFIFKI